MNLIKFLEATIPVFHKWNPGEKRMRKRTIRRAHRGTNWSVLKSKKDLFLALLENRFEKWKKKD